MKLLLRFCVSFYVLFVCQEANAKTNFLPKDDTLSVLNAKAKGHIAIIVRGAFNPNGFQPELKSAHYGRCIDVKMKNLSDSTVHLVLESGTRLISRDSNAQDMLITKTMYYSLKPDKKIISDRLYAMCGEMHKNAPDMYVYYDVGQKEKGHLLNLTQIIESTQSQDQAGQYALWAVTDKATKKELSEDYDVLQQSQSLLMMAGIDYDIFGENKVGKNKNLHDANKKVTPKTHKEQIPNQTENISLQPNSEEIQLGESSYLTDAESEGMMIGIAGVLALSLTFYYIGRTKTQHKKAKDIS
jgi:hypothetical protein